MDAHVWEFGIDGEVRKYMTDDGVSPGVLVTPDGERVEITDLDEKKGVSVADLISTPVGQYDVADVDLQFYAEFEGAGLKEFLEINKGHVTLRCPECKNSQVNRDSFVEYADRYGISTLGVMVGDGVGALFTVAEMLKDYGVDPQRIGEIFNLERKGNVWECKNCGASIVVE